jgi:hypothetical protein
MLLRRLILVLLLFALGVCAMAGMFAVFLSSPRHLEPVIGAAIAIGIAMGLLLPLTFLVDRPKFRMGGIGLMCVVALALICVLGLFLSDAMPWPARRTLEDMFLIGLGFTSLVALPAAGALLLDSFAWARIAVRCFAVAGVISLILGGVAGATVRIYPTSISEQFAMGAVLTAVLGLLAALLLVNVGQGDRRYFRFPALAVVGVTALLTFFQVVSKFRLGPAWNSVYGILWVIIGFCAHLNLLLMARTKPAFAWLRGLTIGASIVCGTFVVIAVFHDDTETIVGLILAPGIASLCGSLALVALTLMNRRFDYRADATPSGLLKEIQLTCPRCSKSQTLPLGDSLCSQCGLKFSIQATEPQCLQCGYLLYGLSTPRCPECGAAVPTSAAAAPAVSHISTALASDR